jgi:hypothetical protein
MPKADETPDKTPELEQGLTRQDTSIRESIIINHNPDVTFKKCNNICIRNCLCSILAVTLITAGNIYISYLMYHNNKDDSNSC